jgi:large subunit ribosomal protein L29
MSKKMEELKNLAEAELTEKLISLKQKLIESRLLAASGRLEKPAIIRNARRDIARIMTIKSEVKSKKAKNG